MTPFDIAVNLILDHEGGYVNDPRDPGGETKYGISKRAYPNINIRDLTKEKAKEIYRRDYWDKIRGNSLPFSVAIVAFDMAVNMGVKTAIKMLQGSVDVKQDGILGDRTMAAVVANSSHYVVEKMTNGRLQYYADLPTFPIYKSGWIRRSIETLVFSLTAHSRLNG